jgi:uncharacterized protein YndB with AHSA1/START domain
MLTLLFSTTINSPREIVWQNLWNDAPYRKWTAPFMEGSYAESNWEEGDTIRFLSPGNNGMFGVIQTKIPNQEMTFRHLGEIKNGVEEIKDWKHATESYRLEAVDNTTTLKVSLTMENASTQFENYFNEAFPKALAVLKQLCEGTSS